MAREPQFTLPLGKLVSQSFGVYFRNFIPFLLLAALLLSPWIALRVLVPAGPSDTGIQLLGSLVQMLTTYLLTGAVTYGVVHQLRGQPRNMSQTVSKGMQAFTRLLGTGILCGIRIMLFTLLLIIPGIIESCRLYIALPAAVMENTAGERAIARSIHLTNGSKWQIFGSWFVMFSLPMVAAWIAGFAYGTVTAEGAIPAWFEIAIALVFSPLSAVAMSVCYFLLREGKESKSVEELAAVFD